VGSNDVVMCVVLPASGSDHLEKLYAVLVYGTVTNSVIYVACVLCVMYIAASQCIVG
jgi:hypothetical protein